MSISVVIPAYNAESTLKQAIDSVLNQSVPPLEIIVVDDGSKDRTAAIADSFGSQITFYRKPNGGSSQARNYGIQRCRGEWLAFLDSDDQWYSNHLCDLKRQAELNPELSWVFGRYECYKGSKFCRQSSLGTSKVSPTKHVYDESLQLLADGCSIWTGAVLIRKSAILEVNGFDELQKTSHDVDLWFKLAIRYPEIGFSPAPVARYQIGQATSLTATATSEGDKTWFRLIERMIEAKPSLPLQRQALVDRYIAYKINGVFRNAVVRQNYDYAQWLIDCCLRSKIALPALGLRIANRIPRRVMGVMRRLLSS